MKGISKCKGFILFSVFAVVLGLMPIPAKASEVWEYTVKLIINDYASLPEAVQQQWGEGYDGEGIKKVDLTCPPESYTVYYELPTFSPVQVQEQKDGATIIKEYRFKGWEMDFEALYAFNLPSKKGVATYLHSASSPVANELENGIVEIFTNVDCTGMWEVVELPQTITQDPPAIIEPLPTEQPTKEPPVVKIEEEATPLAEVTEEEQAVLEEPLEEPLEEAAVSFDEEEIISDEVPLTDIPKTDGTKLAIGSGTRMLLAAVGVTGIVLIAWTLDYKKQRK